MTFVLTHENPARQIFCECSAGGSNDKAREKTIVQQDEGLFQVIIPLCIFKHSLYIFSHIHFLHYWLKYVWVFEWQVIFIVFLC